MERAFPRPGKFGIGRILVATAAAICIACALFALIRLTGARLIASSGHDSAGFGQAAGLSRSPAMAPADGKAAVPKGRQVATLAGGCFWALQSEFEELRGVDRVVAGYAGGKTRNPTYEDVCTGMTGHAESIQITFDPKKVSYTDLLRIFLTDIDPTTKDRQGNDAGTQYRSVIFYHDAAQQAAARQAIERITASRLYSDPIVTEVVPFSGFYPAEAYHQDYFAHNPQQPYCAQVVAPEVSRFRKLNSARLKPGG